MKETLGRVKIEVEKPSRPGIRKESITPANQIGESPNETLSIAEHRCTAQFLMFRTRTCTNGLSTTESTAHAAGLPF